MGPGLGVGADPVESPGRVAAPDRSSPVSASPVAVVCTWASVKAGVTSAPSRCTVSSTPSAKESAAPSEPIQAMLPPSTTIAVAKGSAGLWTSPPRSRRVRGPVREEAVLSLMGTVSRSRGAGGPRGARRGARTAGQMRGGRASYGVERTTVVRVDTPERVRMRARRCSSSMGVATRTLRM